MITKKEKKLKRELMLKLMNENEDWESDENIRKEVRSLADEISGQISHKSKPVTKLKRHIIHLVKKRVVKQRNKRNSLLHTAVCNGNGRGIEKWLL